MQTHDFVFSNRGTFPLPGYDHLGRKVLFARPGVADPNKFKVFFLGLNIFLLLK
jgi:hypothetical protein